MDRLRTQGCDAEADATTALLSTVPTTPAGGLALVKFIQADIAADGGMAGRFGDTDADLFLDAMAKYFEAVQSS